MPSERSNGMVGNGGAVRPGALGRLPAPSDALVVLATIALAYLLVQFSFVPVSAILPSIAGSFGATQEAAGWVMNAYLLSLAGCLLVAGKLGDLAGHRRIFATGIVVFGAATLLAAAAPSLSLLVAARSLQGVGAALISGNSLAIIAGAFAGRGIGRAIGLVTTASFVGSAFGVLVASYAASTASWRWAFGMAIPVALVGLLGASRLPQRPPSRRRALDLPGAALFCAAMVTLSLSLSHLHEGPETFEAGAPYHFSMQALALALFIGFVLVERRAAEPVLAFSHFRNVFFSGSVAANGFVHFAMMGQAYLLPVLVEGGLRLGPMETASLVLVTQLTSVFSSLGAGWLHDRLDAPWLRSVAGLLVAAGLGTLGLYGASLPYLGFMPIMFVFGLAMGAFSTVNNAVAVTALGPDNRGVASGLLETTRQLGHSLAVSISTTAMVAVAGPLVVGTTPPELVLRGFQAACLLVSLVALFSVPATLIRGPRAAPAAAWAPEPARALTRERA